MNRIILVGNGFDKAHGMATSYREFMDSYWKKVEQNVFDGASFRSYKDDFIHFKIPGAKYDLKTVLPKDNNVIDSYPKLKSLIDSCNDTSVELEFLNNFWWRLSETSLNKWVDVENEYYAALVEILRKQEHKHGPGLPDEIENLEALNKDFKAVSRLLEEYLSNIEKANDKILSVQDKILAPLKAQDIAHSHKMGLTKHIQQRIDKIDVESKRLAKQDVELSSIYDIEDFRNGNIQKWVNDLRAIEERGNRRQQIRKSMEQLPSFLSLPEEVLILNFNYTDTVERYISASSLTLLPHVECIYIHGRLNDKTNPIIFGYGDELDTNYKAIEDRNDNRYLEYIKSTGYHRTDGYRRLLEFAESGYFQVFIMGHSCGNSDRTLLNTLFEHPNCMSIKPFYHQISDEEDNYSDIVRNISRNFKDKQLMRARVVNKTYCEPLVKN